MTEEKKSAEEKKHSSQQTEESESELKEVQKKESDSKKTPLKRAKPVARRPKPKQEEKPLPPSPKQSVLENYVQKVTKKIHSEAIEESYINRAGEHLPTLFIRKEDWFEVVSYLKTGLHFVYMKNYSGVDYQTHMEVVLHLYSFIRQEQLSIRVKLDRDQPVVASLTPLFAAADWNEREMYDLLGIQFTGHPRLTRILMPEDWEGHPLRKDYQPLDKGV